METYFKVIIASGGTLASYLYGGWSALLIALVAFVVLDYVTGMLASAHEGKLSSKVGLKGVTKKVFIFAMVAVAHVLDGIIGDNHLLRDATIFFYIANELLSILENAGRMDLSIPQPLMKAVEVLKTKGDK